MSHGKFGAILGVHWQWSDPELSRDEFPIDNIYKHLNTQNCPALKDKPKVIIIQACRGGDLLIIFQIIFFSVTNNYIAWWCSHKHIPNRQIWT